jgi:hypothetical protein
MYKRKLIFVKKYIFMRLYDCIYLKECLKDVCYLLCFLVRASSYIPISRPTDATCDRFLFSIYMCITLHVSSVKRSSSGVPHLTYSLQFLYLCLSAALSCKKILQDSAADRHKHRKLEAVCTVRDF